VCVCVCVCVCCGVARADAAPGKKKKKKGEVPTWGRQHKARGPPHTRSPTHKHSPQRRRRHGLCQHGPLGQDALVSAPGCSEGCADAARRKRGAPAPGHHPCERVGVRVRVRAAYGRVAGPVRVASESVRGQCRCEEPTERAERRNVHA